MTNLKEKFQSFLEPKLIEEIIAVSNIMKFKEVEYSNVIIIILLIDVQMILKMFLLFLVIMNFTQRHHKNTQWMKL